MRKSVLVFALLASQIAFAQSKDTDSVFHLSKNSVLTMKQDIYILPQTTEMPVEGTNCKLSYPISDLDRVLKTGREMKVASTKPGDEDLLSVKGKVLFVISNGPNLVCSTIHYRSDGGHNIYFRLNTIGEVKRALEKMGIELTLAQPVDF